MKNLYNKSFIILFLCLFTISSCKNNNDDNTGDDSEATTNDENSNSSTDGYADGSYCAEVQYYYAETGTRSTYTLLVDIEDNELVKIHWPNGGWLDNSHFSPPDISEGSATFTSDRGVEYTVTIMGKEGDCQLSPPAEDEDDLMQDQEDQEEEKRRQQDEEFQQEQQRRNEEKEEMQRLENENNSSSQQNEDDE